MQLIHVGCVSLDSNEQKVPFVFTAIDVGQGLAQIGKMGNNAILWDCGDSSSVAQWQKEYASLERPFINAIIISHHHADHLGGFKNISSSLPFSGLVITTTFEDTSFIRSQCGEWFHNIRFRCVGQGDTIGALPGVSIECVWPPRDAFTNSSYTKSNNDTNRYSLCFKIAHGKTSVLLTSDIDSVAEKILWRTYGFSLASDVMVVPHYGSASSADPVFYGYVNPENAIISCGRNNSYGMPAQNVTDLLFQMKVRDYETDKDGTVLATSNGEYWTFSTHK